MRQWHGRLSWAIFHRRPHAVAAIEETAAAFDALGYDDDVSALRSPTTRGDKHDAMPTASRHVAINDLTSAITYF